MRLLLLVVLALAVAGCDVFRASEPYTPPCEKTPLLTVRANGRVDTVGYFVNATFYCRVDTARTVTGVSGSLAR